MDEERLGLLVCGHGTRDADGVAEFADLVERLRGLVPWPTAYGYLEFARPLLREGLESLRAQGANRLLAVPGMLFAAGHAKNDIPSVLNRWAEDNPSVRVEYGRELGLTAEMLRAAAGRVRAALAAEEARGFGLPPEETVLVVVGRGASDPDANANVAKVTRLLQESFGFGWAITAYSGVTFPLVSPALERAARLGFGKILVFPYFLFTGRLVDRIYEHTATAAKRFPGIRFVRAPYLNDHEGVVNTFLERIEELLHGRPEMNCQLCKYRAPLPGFEREVGLPQESHHHHVEGIGTDRAPGGAPSTQSPRPAPGHGHAHPRYPHADHPFGPRTLAAASSEGQK